MRRLLLTDEPRRESRKGVAKTTERVGHGERALAMDLLLLMMTVLLVRETMLLVRKRECQGPASTTRGHSFKVRCSIYGKDSIGTDTIFLVLEAL